MRWLVVWRAGEGNRAGVCASAAASADDQPYYEDGDEETNSAADDGIVDPLWEATSGRQGRRGWQGWRWGWWWLGHISHSLRSDASSRERRRAGETMAVFSFGQKLGPNLNGCPIKCCDEQSQMCDSIHSCIWELNLTFVYILYKYKYTLYSTFRHVGAVSSPLSCPRSSQRNSGSVRSFREAGLCTSTYHARRPLPQPTQHAFIGAPSSYSP